MQRLSISALAVVILLVAGSATAAPDEKQDARRAVLAFSAAWNKHDMAAFGKLFAPDADFVNVVGMRWKGREEIRRNTAWLHGTIPESTHFDGEASAVYGVFRDSTLKFTQIDVRFVRTDVAIAHANLELLGDKLAKRPRRAILSFVLIRQSGGWLIAAAQNTEIGGVVP